MEHLPVLYSFRRCPYAMRARLAIASSQMKVQLREVVLQDKPDELIKASPKATVPVLVLPDGKVIEESRQIMDWALTNNDRQGWLDWPDETLHIIEELVEAFDGPFKTALDRYKYSNRYADADFEEERKKASCYILKLESMLTGKPYLFGDRFSFADGAILPFIRQFAYVDIKWFSQQDWHNVIDWLDRFIASERFIGVMTKYKQWQRGTSGELFPAMEVF